MFDAVRARLRERSLAALNVTHNPELAARMDRTVTLRDGWVVAAGYGATREPCTGVWRQGGTVVEREGAFDATWLSFESPVGEYP